jgi:hypothetical protein
VKACAVQVSRGEASAISAVREFTCLQETEKKKTNAVYVHFRVFYTETIML